MKRRNRACDCLLRPKFRTLTDAGPELFSASSRQRMQKGAVRLLAGAEEKDGEFARH